MVAGQDRNRPRAPPGNLHDHAAGAAQHVAAAHRAQVSADQPGAGARQTSPAARIRRSAVGCASASARKPPISAAL